MTINTQQMFSDWLSSGDAKKYSPSVIVSCVDKISEYAVNKKICTTVIWEMKQINIFKPVYLKILDAKLLRITDNRTYKTFIVAGKLYMKFLKEKPWGQALQTLVNKEKENGVSEVKPFELESAVKPTVTSALTIKEAVVYVLNDIQKPMTADEIYSKIVERKLYTFGAQNPINVVRNIIESACDNSTYSEKYRVAIPCFHYKKNGDGKRIYSLLNSKQTEVAQVHEPSAKESSVSNNPNLIIWDNRIEQSFQKWFRLCENIINLCKNLV